MEQQTFKVVCVWCGDVIRFNHSKNSQGMCMKCHARMLRDYNLAHMQRDASLRASER
jgi:hypothetical protein